MQKEKISLADTGFFQPLFIEYANQNPELKPFLNEFPRIENFEEIIKARRFSKERRMKLYEEIIDQYKDIRAGELVMENIQSLVRENCYTVTTGHQLNIFTGPLYFIYKIVTVINTCRILSKEFPERRFVPVYWMASEDHDFEEISNFRLFGKTYRWETEARGPVGRLHPGSLKSVLDQIPEKIPMFEEAYTRFNHLSDSVRYYVNELFGKYGLVVIEPDNKTFKSFFRDVMADDLDKFTASRLVESASAELSEIGFKSQVSPRPINLFYMDEQGRNRIIRESEWYEVADTPRKFNRGEIQAELMKNPEKFSPNVVLRPVYQEMILPNIGYVGGPAEIAYWLQLKKVFNYYKIQFPILIPRNSALYINNQTAVKLEKFAVRYSDLFLDIQHLKTKYILEKSGNNLNLEKEKQILQELFESIKYKAISVDGSLDGLVGAESARTLKGFENIEKRIIKAEEKNQEITMRQLENIKEKLFPEGKLQERTDNFLNFYLNKPGFINELVDHLEPLDFNFNILIESDPA